MLNLFKKESPQEKGQLTDNPYLQSSKLFNDVYGSAQTRLENAYRLIAILALVIVVAVAGLVSLSKKPKIEPFVAVVHGSDVLPVATLRDKQFTALKPKLADYFIRHFIVVTRTVSPDGNLNRDNHINALSLTSGDAGEVLSAFYQRHNPNTLARKTLTQVRITSVLKKTANTFQVRWQEINREAASGKTTGEQSFIAEITYHFDKPANDKAILQFNPLGFYITHLSWGQESASLQEKNL